MAVDFEPIAEALLEAIRDSAIPTYATRQWLAPEQLPEYPAITLMMNQATATRSGHGRPIVWRAQYIITYIDRVDGSEASTESRLNEWLVALQDSLEPEGEEVLTLGSLCEHCWIVGEVNYFPPTTEDPWMVAKVAVEVQAIA